MVDLSRTASICRQCHNAVQCVAKPLPSNSDLVVCFFFLSSDCIDEESLAMQYNSISSLILHEGVARFVAWASKQRGRADNCHRLQIRR